MLSIQALKNQQTAQFGAARMPSSALEEPDASPRDEQLAASKAEHSIAPSDIIHEVSINFA